ncbi:MAG TPA: ABC transporter [Dehalococcoidia bacterium]|nr:ABC transporter ATP-binding protein [Chloroflexota bacterium]HAI09606.1 ABC transporter [Dehalococcoidia bacterium]|tara:strand:+ start:1123 stop:2046 length:924 start_codon:yes stop_codon:yes gene_type:complete
MDTAIRVEGLVKRYGSFTAVDQVSFTVNRGEIFGILGPNGAGKTTTLEVIEGLLAPTEGEVTVLGLDVLKRRNEVKARIGVQLQSSAYFDYLSLKEILSLLGSFYPKRIEPQTLLEQVGLLDKSGSYVKHLSGGQVQRFTVAASLINDPELLFLDEPTTGLDPQARRNIWGLIREIHQRGVTVVLTTHYMEEAEELCDRLAIMDGGSLKAVDTPRNLVGRLQAAYTVKLAMDNPLTEDQMASLNGSVEFVQELDGNSYLLRLKSGPSSLGKVLDEMVRSDINLERLEIAPVTLEDVFLELTGNELRD